MENPCRDCILADEDKNSEPCLKCSERVKYVAAIGNFPDLGPPAGKAVTTKVCSNPDCASNGRAQPAENFYKQKQFISRNNPEGRSAQCKACMKKAIAARKAAMKANKKNRAADPKKSLTLTIDFSNHPEVLEAIGRIAADELRTQENQVLYWLKTQTKGDCR